MFNFVLYVILFASETRILYFPRRLLRGVCNISRVPGGDNADFHCKYLQKGWKASTMFISREITPTF